MKLEFTEMLSNSQVSPALNHRLLAEIKIKGLTSGLELMETISQPWRFARNPLESICTSPCVNNPRPSLIRDV